MKRCTECNDPIRDPWPDEDECPQCAPRADGFAAAQQEAYVEGYEAGFEAGALTGSDEITLTLSRRACCQLVQRGQINTLPADIRDRIYHFAKGDHDHAPL